MALPTANATARKSASSPLRAPIKLHGTAFEFIRNSALDARNYFDQGAIPEFQRNQFGASLGGPIRANKLFLFANYEGFRQNWGLSAVTLVPDNQARLGYLPDSSGQEQYVGVNPAVAPLLALWPVQNGPELGSGIGEAFSHPPQHIREDFGTTRFDDNLGGKDLLFAVYTVDDSTANTPSQNPLSLIDESLREQVLSVQEQHVFSPALLNTARFGYSRASYFFTGYSPVSIPGWVAGQPIGAIVISGSTASNGASPSRRRASTLAATTPPRAISSPWTITFTGRTAVIRSKSACGCSAFNRTTCWRRINTARPRSAPCNPSCRAR